MTQDRLVACAGELQKLSDMMLEVARLRDAIQEAQVAVQHGPTADNVYSPSRSFRRRNPD